MFNYWNAPPQNKRTDKIDFDGFTSAPRWILWKAYAEWKATGRKPGRKEFVDRLESDWDRDLDVLDQFVMRAEPEHKHTDYLPLQA